MSRTMSGIPSSGGGDVKLDGNPNAFTGTNSFNINLPTSTLTTTTANDEFITKAIGDTIYGSGTGDAILSGGSAAVPQQFTGFNVFTNEIEQKDNSTDINSFRQTENSTAVGAGNFIEQDGVGKGHITQRADNSVIRQNGNNSQIIQGTATTTGAVFKQEGDDAEIKQEGVGVEFKQNSTFAAATPNIISTTGFVRAGQAPAIGDDCVNKTYFDANKGTGDALLAGTNAFTGANSFNSTRPTTTILATGATAAGADDFICKRDGDALYQAAGGGGGSPICFYLVPPAHIVNGSPQIMDFGIAATNPNLISFTEPASLINSFSNGIFTATAADVGFWSFTMKINWSGNAARPRLDIAFIKILTNGTQVAVASCLLEEPSSFNQANPTAVMNLALGEGVAIKLTTAPFIILCQSPNFTHWSGHKL